MVPRKDWGDTTVYFRISNLLDRTTLQNIPRPVLKTPEDLIQIITTIVWVTSGHHAAVNFGQYDFAGYFPNRPSTARKNIPSEYGYSSQEWKEFVDKPEIALLHTFPSQAQASKVMAVLDVLSTHSPDEEYMGEHMEAAWKDNPEISSGGSGVG
uniref:Lipoxygenase domain-containing protein n=1 Tax=Kalanchoe fedtschenkoi TaxID=63787 RepID=A0A7N0VIT5_KALFE